MSYNTEMTLPCHRLFPTDFLWVCDRLFSFWWWFQRTCSSWIGSCSGGSWWEAKGGVTEWIKFPEQSDQAFLDANDAAQKVVVLREERLIFLHEYDIISHPKPIHFVFLPKTGVLFISAANVFVLLVKTDRKSGKAFDLRKGRYSAPPHVRHSTNAAEKPQNFSGIKCQVMSSKKMNKMNEYSSR